MTLFPGKAAEIKGYELTIKHFSELLATAEAELAAMDKPELKHGDYGYNRGGQRILLTEIGDVLKSSTPLSGECYSPKRTDQSYVILDNIFDDLADVEPLEEFEVEDGYPLKVRVDGTNIQFIINNRLTSTNNLKTSKEIHHNLGRVIAFLEAKKDK